MSTTVEPHTPAVDAPPWAPPEGDTPVGALPPLTATEFPAIGLAKRVRFARLLAKALVGAFVLTLCGLVFLPWQQNVSGRGRVTALNPLERAQTIESPVSGRIVTLPDGIVDNVAVKKGDVLVEIGGVDPFLVQNLTLQLNAAQQKVANTRSVIGNYEAKLDFEQSNRDFSTMLIEQQIAVARQELAVKEAKRPEAEAEERRALQVVDRAKRLLARGAESEDKVEDAERKERTTAAKLAQVVADINTAAAKVKEKQRSLDQKLAEIDAKIESARAQVEDARGKMAQAEKELADAQSKLNKQNQQVIRAPRDGFIATVFVAENQPVKPGDKLITFVPDSANPAVELWIDGNDVPLVSSIVEDGTGSHVRLQFEGWPAVQFAGWPSVAVGTFGGEVHSVAQNDAGSGNFRLMIVPDPTDQAWPSTNNEPGRRNYLRQGALTKGWVLLNRVSLGYELWRQLNGFPPTVLPGEDATAKSGPSPPKDDKASKPPKVKL